MNIVLTKEMEEIVSSQIASGRYSGTLEVVYAALRLLEQQFLSDDEELQQFEAEMVKRLAALDCGEFVTMEAAKAHFAEKSRELRRLRA